MRTKSIFKYIKNSLQKPQLNELFCQLKETGKVAVGLILQKQRIKLDINRNEGTIVQHCIVKYPHLGKWYCWKLLRLIGGLTSSASLGVPTLLHRRKIN